VPKRPAENVGTETMTQLLAPDQVNRIIQVQGTFDMPRRLEGSAGKPEPFWLVGTGRRWIDRDFGMIAVLEDVARALQWSFLQQVNAARAEVAEREADRQAAETGNLPDYFKETPDSQIEHYAPREISESDAKEEILEYLNTNPGADAFDVAVALELDPSFAVRICHRLVSEGNLAFAEDALSD